MPKKPSKLTLAEHVKEVAQWMGIEERAATRVSRPTRMPRNSQRKRRLFRVRGRSMASTRRMVYDQARMSLAGIKIVSGGQTGADRAVWLGVRKRACERRLVPIGQNHEAITEVMSTGGSILVSANAWGCGRASSTSTARGAESRAWWRLAKASVTVDDHCGELTASRCNRGS